jgi:hypothetical protein
MIPAVAHMHTRPASEPPVADKEQPGTVEFSAKVPRDLYDRFKRLVPNYGGTQWFINAALIGFVKRMEENPALTEVVEDSVEAMLQLNRIVKENAA